MPTELPSIETSYSWVRLLASITLSTLGCVGLWSLAVALPAVQADFGVQRAGASLPYALTMIGFMIGGIAVGRLADRFGILPPFAGGTILMGLGYILTSAAPTLPAFAVDEPKIWPVDLFLLGSESACKLGFGGFFDSVAAKCSLPVPPKPF